jgi:succinyl-diaminopimelate desuccinylase
MADPPSAADIHDDTLRLAKRLIACRSLTPADAGCLDLIASRLTAAGFHCERLDRGGVSNIWARRGQSAPLVCLAGHVDVVAPGPLTRWTSDPFVPVERDGYLYGRGAADMKTPLAAMVTAAERVVTAHPNHGGSIAFLLTSDEEGDAVDGTAAVVETLRSRGETIDACIVGEATSSERLGDVMKNGRRGSLTGALCVKGVQCHIAYPERGRNPIHAALPALAELAAIEWDPGNDDFPATGFQISNVHAGTGSINVIPGLFELQFNFRFSPAVPVEQLEARVHEILDRHGLEYDLAWTLGASPFLTPRGRLVHTLSAAVAGVTGLEPQLSTSGGTSDGRFLAAIAREVVEFGPVNASVHMVDERVRLADIGPLSTIYEQAIVRLLADGSFELSRGSSDPPGGRSNNRSVGVTAHCGR